MPDYVQKTLKIEAETVAKIENLGKQAERDFSAQVRYMLKEYLRIIEKST